MLKRNRAPWTKARIEKLVTLYKEGITLDNIAEMLDTPVTTIKSRLRIVRDEYNLPYRDPSQGHRKKRKKNVITDYDKAFSGPIPCGHWMLTRKWELTDEQREALDAEEM